MRGADLISLRNRLGLTQEQLARLIGVSFASVNRWEQPERPGRRTQAPRGPALTFLRALDAAARFRPNTGGLLDRWVARGEIYLWSRVFGLALKHERR